MNLIAQILIGGIALLHLYILWLEMFAWETQGKRVFKGAMPEHLFKPTKTLAANQGLYNGFLAAGLLWTFFISDPVWQKNVAVFFLSCIAIAGVFGGATSAKKIILVQTFPAIIALLFIML